MLSLVASHVTRMPPFYTSTGSYRLTQAGVVSKMSVYGVNILPLSCFGPKVDVHSNAQKCKNNATTSVVYS